MRDTYGNLRAIHRLFICLGIGVITYVILYYRDIKPLTSIILSWDVFSICMIIMSWFLFFGTSCERIRKQAKGQDDSRTIIFVLILSSILISLSGILLAMGSKEKRLVNLDIHAPVSLIGVAISWFLLHTIFTLRYAHLYYGDNKKTPDTHYGGLDFPDEKQPDYLDFAYFSFVLGMTFQVSDVSISSKHIRRLVLLHSLLSFIYNTLIVALSINLIASIL